VGHSDCGRGWQFFESEIEKMNIAVISGGTTDGGKTTLSKMLRAWLHRNGVTDAQYAAVESADKSDDGWDYRFLPTDEDALTLIGMLARTENVVCEIGGHVFSEIRRAADDKGGIEEFFERFVLVVNGKNKPDDVLRLITEYVGMGISAQKITLVFNGFTRDDMGKFKDRYTGLVDFCHRAGVNVIEKPIPWYASIAATARTPTTVFDVAENDTDFAALAHSDPAKKMEYLSVAGYRVEARQAVKIFSSVFEKIVADVAVSES
jgi:hypothetical protein